MEITTKYRPEDQAMIDEAVNNLREYEAVLMDRIAGEDLEDYEAHGRFREDAMRNLLVNTVVRVHQVIIPITTMIMSKQEFKQSSFCKDIPL